MSRITGPGSSNRANPSAVSGHGHQPEQFICSDICIEKAKTGKKSSESERDSGWRDVGNMMEQSVSAGASAGSYRAELPRLNSTELKVFQWTEPRWLQMVSKHVMCRERLCFSAVSSTCCNSMSTRDRCVVVLWVDMLQHERTHDPQKSDVVHFCNVWITQYCHSAKPNKVALLSHTRWSCAKVQAGRLHIIQPIVNPVNQSSPVRSKTGF